MLILYESHSASSTKLERPNRVSQEFLSELKKKAIILMKARRCDNESVKHLEDTPYELWENETISGKKPYLLWWDADADEYADMERLLPPVAIYNAPCPRFVVLLTLSESTSPPSSWD